MWKQSVVVVGLISSLVGCATLPTEFRTNGSFETSEAFGVKKGMAREEAKDVISAHYGQFHFTFSRCLRVDYPNVPVGVAQNTFGPEMCTGEGEDVYHAYSGMRFANIVVVFRGDEVSRVKWDTAKGYFG